MEENERVVVCDRYEALRFTLEELRQEFEYAAKQSPYFFYDWIIAPDKALSRKAWDAFQKGNRSDEQWELWETFPDGNYCGRYFGEQRWLETFRRLGASGIRVLWEIHDHLATHKCGGEDLRLTLPIYGDHFAWLSLIHDTAGLATAILAYSAQPWHLPHDGDDDWDTLVYDTWTTTDDGLLIPTHPYHFSLRMNLFRSSAEAIYQWLHPGDAVSFRDWTGDPPIQLPTACEEDEYDEGQPQAEEEQVEADDIGVMVSPESPILKPRYDRERRSLYWGDKVIKEFKKPAQNQETILLAFEEEDWRPSILDPLPPTENTTPEKKLDDTIHALNSLHSNKDLIRFGGDGTGKGIRWKYVGP